MFGGYMEYLDFAKNAYESVSNSKRNEEVAKAKNARQVSNERAAAFKAEDKNGS